MRWDQEEKQRVGAAARAATNEPSAPLRAWAGRRAAGRHRRTIFTSSFLFMTSVSSHEIGIVGSASYTCGSSWTTTVSCVGSCEVVDQAAQKSAGGPRGV